MPIALLVVFGKMLTVPAADIFRIPLSESTYTLPLASLAILRRLLPEPPAGTENTVVTSPSGVIFRTARFDSSAT
jgi:hypothetical protein